jgi:hypothetical protein
MASTRRTGGKFFPSCSSSSAILIIGRALSLDEKHDIYEELKYACDTM